MAMGYQENNYSPMGTGQKKKPQTNWGIETFGEPHETMMESVAPGIPAASINSTIEQSPTNNTLPIRTGPPVTPQAPTGIPQVFQGFTPVHAMEGFDTGREQNTGKSAKDAFAFLSNQAPPPPLHDKGLLGSWFDQYILPGMNQLGHNAQKAQGDKFSFNNWQGGWNVDFGRGAGAQGGALAWQADPLGLPQKAPANELYNKYQSMLQPQETQSNDLEELLQILMSQNQESL